MSFDFLPVAASVDDLLPVGDPTQPMSAIGERERQRLAVSIAAMTDGDSGSARDRLDFGDRSVITDARQTLSPDPVTATQFVLDEGFRTGEDPYTTSRRLWEEQKKQAEWVAAGDNFYMEQAIAIGDPTISHQAMNLATNLTVAQTMLQEAMDGEIEKAGILKPMRLFGDFVDRYIYRAMPIGGWEMMTNRFEREGDQMLGRAASMSPEEFRVYFADKIQQYRDEGVLASNNIFALQEAMYALQKSGEDDLEWLNRAFGAIDVLGFGQIAKASVKGIVKAATPVQRLAAMKGASEAAEVAAKLADEGDVIAHLDLQPQVLDPAMAPVVRPTSGKLAEMYENNKIIQGISEYAQSGALGRSVRSPEVQRAAKARLDEIAKVSNNPIANVRFPIRADITGNPVIDVQLGTIKTGAPYPNFGGAERVAKKMRENGVPTAKVVPVDPDAPKQGFYISVMENVDVGVGIEALTTTPAFANKVRQAANAVFSSRSAVENRLLNDLAGMNEGSQAVIGNLVKPELKKIEAINSKSRKVASSIYADLRDGPDAFMRDVYNPTELATKWEARAGVAPTQKEIDAFYAIQSVNDAAYIMAAHAKLQKYVREGYRGLELPGVGTVAGKPIRAESLPRGTMVADVASNDKRPFIYSQDMPSNQQVWKLDRDIDGVEYVTKPAEVKMLSHTDVMPYNAGGRRLNPDAKYFVTIGEKNPRAIMQAFSEKQAIKAQDDLTAIQNKIREAGGVKNLKSTEELDDFIRAHNDWNPALQTWDDLAKWLDEKKLDFKQPIGYKARDAQVASDEVTYGLSDTWGEHYMSTLHRYDDAVMEYGGREARQRDPIVGIFEDFTSQTAQFSHNVYTQTALTSWVKAAQRKGSGWIVDNHSDPRRAFELARREGTDRTARASELDYQRNIIQSRMRMNGEYGRMMSKIGSGIQEAVFDISKGKVRLADNAAEVGEGKLLGLGFQSVFGFLAPAQFFIQGSHAATIAVVAPRHGMKAASMAMPVRMALHADKAVEETIALRRIAKAYGMKFEEMDEMIEFIRQTGRQHIEADAIQKGTSRAWGASGWKGESWRSNDVSSFMGKATERSMEGMTVFFREGEALARMTGQLTAIMEFKAANPGVSIFSDFARRTISRREKDLAMRMNNGDRAVLQQGAMKVPTQWFSHTMRSFEFTLMGNALKPAERARLAFMLTGFYGLTGLGAAKGADYIGEKFGAEPGGALYNAIKNGFYDWAVQAITGHELDLAGRMAPITLVQDLYASVVKGEKTALQVAGGPSVDIATGFGSQFWNATMDLANGRYEAMTEDVIRGLRNITSVDNAYKAWDIIRHGTYRSRQGNVFPGEMSTADAIGVLFGFAPAEVGDWYERSFTHLKINKDRNKFVKRMQADLDLAWTRINDNDESGWQLMKEVSLAIEYSGFSESDKQRIRTSVFEHFGRRAEEIAKLIQREIEQENMYGARVVQETFQAPGTGDR